MYVSCLSCRFGQKQKVNIADMHYDFDYENDKEQDKNSVLNYTIATFVM